MLQKRFTGLLKILLWKMQLNMDYIHEYFILLDLFILQSTMGKDKFGRTLNRAIVL